MWLARGPQGVWTLQSAGKPLPQARCSFAAAKPSLTHQARPRPYVCLTAREGSGPGGSVLADASGYDFCRRMRRLCAWDVLTLLCCFGSF